MSNQSAINGLKDSASFLETNEEEKPSFTSDLLSAENSNPDFKSFMSYESVDFGEAVNLLSSPIKKYAYRHKPTNTWVYFLPNRESNPVIALCLKSDASFFEDQALLKEKFLKSSFNGEKDYCKYNFLEFEMVAVNF